MRISDLSHLRLILLHSCLFLIPIAAWTQTPTPQSRIVERVNESALVTLRGNTHPLAQPQFDQGAAPPDLPMARMLLVLKRSDAQETALETLLDAQQDRNSPSYHQWLTPDAFGQQFGPSNQDIQAIASWLQSRGFQVAPISRGRTVIEFSGTAAQVQQAFHTEIHKYTINGENHWANANDPQIPGALSPVVEGVASLHNFPKQPANHLGGVFSKSRTTGRVSLLQPGYTLPHACGGITCYFVGPYDFATIYNILPLWSATPAAIDGTGQSIAVLGESNINPQDVADFRSLFGLPPNVPNVIVDGADPGLVSGAETEADLDVEWSGAVAKGATISLVIAQPTEATGGVDLAAVRAIEDNIAPIISESFLQCELFLGAAGNSFQNSIREQAAAQGITFLTASGDQGSSGCDFFSGNAPDPATHGLMVNGLATSPYGVAVGGTDFLNFGSAYNQNAPSPYWSQTNDTHQASALGYIPETAWNSSCTNNVFVIFKYGATPEASCNNSQAIDWVETIAAGGGKSNCTSPSGSSCSGGYGKPSWQSAPGVPADGARDIPDVSLFASSGFMGSAYIVCEADHPQGHGSCGLNAPEYDFLGIGGTSVSTPAFAGIMALVNQFTQSTGQGNANHVLYKLASSASQTNASCNASSNPAGNCIFNDVTNGTIATPCAAHSPDCSLSVASNTYGVLSGYSAATGYDLATGLGSVNAYNLVHAWAQPGISTTTTLSLNSNKAVTITHGQAVPFNIAVSPAAATGDVSLIGFPSNGNPVSMGGFLTLQNGAVSGSTTSLAGGTSYQVKAQYAGDNIYAPSDSAPVTVTVASEPSTTLISIPVFDSATGRESGNNPASLVYGSPYIERVDVGNAKAALTFPMQPVCAQLTCPTGKVILTDSLNGAPAVPLGATGSFALNSQGYAEFQSIQLVGGSHQLTASYPGDNSYGPSSGSYNLTVTPATTQIAAPGIYGPVIAGISVSFSTIVTTNLYSVAEPTGTITFYDGSALIPGSFILYGQPGTSTSYATLTGEAVAEFTSGSHAITAKYSGDANYAPAISPPANISVLIPTTPTLTANPINVNLGQTVTITATVASSSKSPPMTGTFQFLDGDPVIPGPVTPTLSTDADGNQVLTASVTTTPNPPFDLVQLSYSGDANYAPGTAQVGIYVTIPDFTIGTDAPNLTITAGQSGSTKVTVTPLSNVSSSVAVICSGPFFPGVTFSFNPASPFSLSNGASASTVLTITTLPVSPNTSTSFVSVPRRKRFHIPPPGWWLLDIACGMAILLLSFWPARNHRQLGAGIGMVCLLCLVVGCGGASIGGSSGNGGGGNGGGGLVPTSLIISTSSIKVPYGTNATIRATVNSTKPVTGSVQISDTSGNTGTTISLVNGTGTTQLGFFGVGIHMLTGQYSGDANNLPSSTNGAISQVVTGTNQMYVSGSTSILSRETPLTVTIQ
jgi:hypothetical protein